jgi:hypothetical protein
MGLDDTKRSRLKGTGLRLLGTQKVENRMYGQSQIEQENKSEDIKLGMKLVQRDDPAVNWEVAEINDDIVVLHEPSKDAYVSKKIDRLVKELNTPDSPWARA